MPLRPRFYLVTAYLLLAVSLGSLLWLQSLGNSLAAYRSPLRTSLPLRDPTTPVARQVLLVVVEGLTPDLAGQMPLLQDLRKQGAWATLRVAPYAGDLALLTGAAPELSGLVNLSPTVTALFTDTEAIPQPGAGGVGSVPYADDLCSAVRRLERTVFLAGPQRWAASVPSTVTERFVPPETGAAGDAAVVQQAIRRLDFWLPELAVVVLSQLHEPPAGPQALDAARTTAALATDAQIAALWRMAQTRQPGQTVLIVTGSEDGAPFVLAGQGAVAGSYGDVAAGDVSLTIAALLGASLPNLAQGQIVSSMVRMDAAVLAEKQIALAQQRMALADAYLDGIGAGATSDDVADDLAVATSALAAHGNDNAYRLASQSAREADQEMAAGTANRQEEERRLRWPLLLLAAFPPLYAAISLLTKLGTRVRLLMVLHLVPASLLRPWRPANVAGLAAAAAAYWAYQRMAHDRPFADALALALAGGALAAWGALWVWCALKNRDSAEKRRKDARGALWGPEALALRPATVDLGGAACSFALAFVYLFAVPLADPYVQYGIGPTWYLPPPGALLSLRYALIQACAAAFLAVGVVWVSADLDAVKSAVRLVRRWTGRSASA